MNGTRVSGKFSLASGRMVLAVAALVVGLQVAHAQQHKRKSIDFSDPKDGDVVTNFASSIPVRNGLKDMEDELVKPLEHTFNTPQPSFDPGAVRYVPSGAMMIQSKKAKQLMDQKKNWEFADPKNMMMPGVTPEEMMNLPGDYTDDGQLKSSLPMMQQYFLSQTKDGKAKDKLNSRQRSSRDAAGSDQKDRADDGLDPIDPNDSSASRRQLNGRNGQVNDSSSVVLDMKDPKDSQDSARISDMFGGSDSSDDSPDQLAKQAKLQAQNLRSFESAVGWPTPSTSVAEKTAVGSMFNDSVLFGMPAPAVAPAYQPALGGSIASPLPTAASTIYTPAISASSDPSYAPPVRQPTTTQPASVPFANSGYVLPKRSFP